MNVAVFGGTGGVGRHVVDQLLVQGHSIAIPARDPAKVKQPASERLRVIAGGLDDPAAIEQVVAGSDAVISALGPSLDRNTKGTPVANGTAAIVAAMERAGVRRYIGMATPSIPDLRDRPTLRAKLLRRMASVGLPNALRELDGMTEAIERSGLEWTVARFIRPTNGAATGHIRSGFLGRDSIGWSITRVDIAAFLVAQLTDVRFIRAAPVISN